MVDVSDKPVTQRTARAECFVQMACETQHIIRQGKAGKGDVLETARLAGIMASKRTDHLIPLCHSLNLDAAELDFSFPEEGLLRIESTITATGRTGVEMEALTAVAVAGLTIYDMCKAIDRTMELQHVRLIEKKGGRSGHFVRPEAAGGS